VGSKDDWIVRIAIEMERSDWEKPMNYILKEREGDRDPTAAMAVASL